MLKPKYKLSGRPVFTLVYQEGNSLIYVFTYSKLSLLQRDTSWWRSLVYGRACNLSN